MGVLERARADLAAGRAWKARDRLLGAAASRADDQLLGLLGQVLFDMGDLPAAGAAWFGTTRHGSQADAAAAAWRERHGADPEQLWRSLAPPVQELPLRQVKALRKQAQAAAAARSHGGSRRATGSSPQARRRTPELADLVDLALAGVALAALICFGVGLWTIIRWVL